MPVVQQRANFRMIDQLRNDHDRLRDLADRLDRFLDSDAPPIDPEFSQLRWILVRELSMHLASERAALEAWRAKSRGNDHDLDFELDDAFMQHIVAWSGATMSTRWKHYCESTRALLHRLRQRMEFEETSMFPAMGRRRFA